MAPNSGTQKGQGLIPAPLIDKPFSYMNQYGYLIARLQQEGRLSHVIFRSTDLTGHQNP